MEQKAKKEIVRIIQRMSGKYSSDMIFSDFVFCCAVAIQNGCQITHGKVWKQREEQYIQTRKKYSEGEGKEFSHMLVLLAEAMEEDMRDVLGEIYMEAECGSKQTRQFFTPFHLSLLSAETSIPKDISEDKMIELNEPSAGGGGMIIAAAKVLHQRGINYQKILRVTAQDLDWRSVYMTYVQLSLLGIDAVVVQGDTLQNPYVKGNYPEEHIFRTPRRMGMLV